MYTASSVITAIQKSIKCSSKGLEYIKCPKDDCNTSLDECLLAKSRNCLQSIMIYDNYKNPTILQFIYPISINNNDGFINENNSSLQRLFAKGIIDKNTLVKI